MNLKIGKKYYGNCVNDKKIQKDMIFEFIVLEYTNDTYLGTYEYLRKPWEPESTGKWAVHKDDLNKYKIRKHKTLTLTKLEKALY
jgi:hypothetical protein